MKNKETLEEALNKFKEEHTVLNLYPSNILQNIAEFGAKWQQQQMYSEEEVHKILGSYSAHIPSFSPTFTYQEWFEQFKNK